jgi:hypothetical protein
VFFVGFADVEWDGMGERLCMGWDGRIRGCAVVGQVCGCI